MDNQQAHLDALNKTIQVQQELIDFLKKEIQRLQPVVSYQPNIVTGPYIPNYNPNPLTVNPNTILNPFAPPFTITCDQASATSGDLILRNDSYGTSANTCVADGSMLSQVQSTYKANRDKSEEDVKSFGVVVGRRP